MKYNRILLKLSGESLAGDSGSGICPDRLSVYARQIGMAVNSGVQVAIVVGGGNIFRGLAGAAKGFDRVTGDQMGMLATVINSLALRSALEGIGIGSVVLTAVRMEPIGEYYSREKAISYLDEGKVVIIGAGTSNPYFTTDTASVLRAIEICSDVILKGTRVDGIYSADPEIYPDAIRYDKITFEQIYREGLKIMDLTAFTLCRENNMPIVVFDMDTEGNLEKLLAGKRIGTVVTN